VTRFRAAVRVPSTSKIKIRFGGRPDALLNSEVEVMEEGEEEEEEEAGDAAEFVTFKRFDRNKSAPIPNPATAAAAAAPITTEEE